MAEIFGPADKNTFQAGFVQKTFQLGGRHLQIVSERILAHDPDAVLLQEADAHHRARLCLIAPPFNPIFRPATGNIDQLPGIVKMGGIRLRTPGASTPQKHIGSGHF